MLLKQGGGGGGKGKKGKNACFATSRNLLRPKRRIAKGSSFRAVGITFPVESFNEPEVWRTDGFTVLSDPAMDKIIGLRLRRPVVLAKGVRHLISHIYSRVTKIFRWTTPSPRKNNNGFPQAVNFAKAAGANIFGDGTGPVFFNFYPKSLSAGGSNWKRPGRLAGMSVLAGKGRTERRGRELAPRQVN